MRWMLVLAITLSSAYVVGQDTIPQETVDVDAELAEAIERGKAEIAAKRQAKLSRGVLLRNPLERMQRNHYLNTRASLPPDPSGEFFAACWELRGLSDDREKYADFNQMYFQPTVQKLQQYAAARIPVNATEFQRRKLMAAALVDIRHAATDFRTSFPTLPERFRVKAGGMSEVFGPSSLFEKVMRQQCLIDNRPTDF